MPYLVSLSDFRIAVVVAGLLNKPKVASVKDYILRLSVPWSVFQEESLQLINCVTEVLRDEDFKNLLSVVREVGLAEAISRTNYLDERHESLKREIEMLQQEVSLCRMSHYGANDVKTLGFDRVDLQIFDIPDLKSQSIVSPTTSTLPFNTYSDSKNKRQMRLSYLNSIRRLSLCARSSLSLPQDDSPILYAIDNVLSDYLSEMETLLNFSLKNKKSFDSEISLEFGYTIRMISVASYMRKFISLFSPMISFRFDTNDATSQRLLFIIIASVRKMFIILAAFLANIETINSQFTPSNDLECKYSEKIMEQINIKNIISTLSKHFSELPFILLYIFSDILSCCTEVIRERKLSSCIFENIEETLHLPKSKNLSVQDRIILSQMSDSKKTEFSAVIYAHLVDLTVDFIKNSFGPVKRVSLEANNDVSSCLVEKCHLLLQDSIAYVPDAISQKIFDILIKISNTQYLRDFDIEKFVEDYFLRDIVRKFSTKSTINSSHLPESV